MTDRIVEAGTMTDPPAPKDVSEAVRLLRELCDSMTSTIDSMGYHSAVTTLELAARAELDETKAELERINTDLHARADDISGIRVELVDRLRALLTDTKAQLARVVGALETCVKATDNVQWQFGNEYEGRLESLYSSRDEAMAVLKETRDA